MITSNLERKERKHENFNTPQVNSRYWTAITLASVLGTNLGDYYAHESGFGLSTGLAVLALLAGAVFAAEFFSTLQGEIYYWLVIILIRTGATNIADALAFRVKIPALLLTLCLAALLLLFGRCTRSASAGNGASGQALPKTDAFYWLAMLTAGVFGTVVGDICSRMVGQGIASLGLTVLLLGVLAVGRGRAAHVVALYWTTVAVARTAGTAIGDWLAENKLLNIGLPLATLITGIAFAAVLALWKRHAKNAPTLVESSSEMA